jgi:hypothetical protein
MGLAFIDLVYLPAFLCDRGLGTEILHRDSGYAGQEPQS